MKAIVAVDLNWGIGFNNQLLERIPEDMKYFKEMTLGKTVVMGRETFESLPGKKPLKERKNIILTTNKNYFGEDMIIYHSLDKLLQEIKAHSQEDVFVIGGESVYSQLLPYCTEIYVTKIEKAYEADKYFINLDKLGWEKVYESEAKNYNGIAFRFTKYVKI